MLVEAEDQKIRLQPLTTHDKKKQPRKNQTEQQDSSSESTDLPGKGAFIVHQSQRTVLREPQLRHDVTKSVLNLKSRIGGWKEKNSEWTAASEWEMSRRRHTSAALLIWAWTKSVTVTRSKSIQRASTGGLEPARTWQKSVQANTCVTSKSFLLPDGA